MYADYHMHSEFSDDSFTPMEQQIERAISIGLDEICFTEHVDYGIKKDWDEDDIKWRGGDGINTDPGVGAPLTNCNYPEYFLKIDRMRKTYGTKIKIKAGLEFGIQVHTIPKYERLIELYDDKMDFILLSFHQVDDLESWNGEWMIGKTRDEYNLKYYEEILKVVSKYDGYDVLAHVDLMSRYDPEGPYPFEKMKDILTDIFKIVIAKGKGIEINTSSWHYKLNDTTPSRDILKLYHDLGGTIITIGSDAHKIEFVGDHFKDAAKILKEIGFENYYAYDHHKPLAHKIED